MVRILKEEDIMEQTVIDIFINIRFLKEILKKKLEIVLLIKKEQKLFVG